MLRQLKRAGIDAAAFEPQWRTMFGRVSNAYRDTEQEHYLLTRSQELASAEMTALYAALQHERDVLESRVLERTAALQASQSRLASLLSLSADWVWEQDAALGFSFVSEGLRSATGLEPAALLGTRGLSALGSPADNGPALERYAASVEAHKPFRNLMLKVPRDDGNVCHLRLTGEPVFGDEGTFLGYRGVGTDVTHTTQADEQVRHTLQQLIQRLLKVISEPLYLNDRHFQVTASIGVSLLMGNPELGCSILRRLNCDHVQGYFFGKPVLPHLLKLPDLRSASETGIPQAGDNLLEQLAQLKANTTSAGA